MGYPFCAGEGHYNRPSRIRRGPMTRFACRLLCLLAVVLAMTHAPLAQTRAQNDKAAADAVKNKGLPLLTDRIADVHHVGGDLAVARSVAGREDDRLRAARRSLHAAGHRRRGEAHHQRPGVRHAAGASRPTARSSCSSATATDPRTSGSRTPTATKAARHHDDRAGELHVADLDAGRPVRDRRERRRSSGSTTRPAAPACR